MKTQFLLRTSNIFTAGKLIALAAAIVATQSALQSNTAPPRPDPSAVRVDVQSLIQKGERFRDQGKYDQAEGLLDTALAAAEQIAGQDDPLTATVLNQIGILDKYAGRFDQGEKAYQRALAIINKSDSSPTEQLLRADLYHNLGGLDHARERYAEGEEYARAGLAIRERLLGSEHPDTVADKAALAALLEGQQKFAEAEALYIEAINVFERENGSDSYDVAIDLNNLAALYFEEGKFAESEVLYRRTLAIKEKLLGLEHPDVGTTLNNLAVLYKTTGRYFEAKPLYRRALAIFEKTLDATHPKLIECRANYAQVLQRTDARKARGHV